MANTTFDPEACNLALREKVAEIFGWPKDTAQLDERQLFYLRMVAEAGALLPGKHLADLGPGLAGFGPVARAMGLEVTLIDDFGGGGNVNVKRMDVTRKLLDGFRDRLGIRVEEMDFLSKPLPLTDNSVDVITCFHSLEHWHHSPKPLFREIIRVLKPGGHLILATPNAVNLRKRLLLPFGVSNYGTLGEWYHDGDPVYRGHVREPTVRDLQRLLEWNNLDLISTYGRNFIGRDSIALSVLPKPVVGMIAIIADCVTRFFPTLCSDIHVIGRKRN